MTPLAMMLLEDLYSEIRIRESGPGWKFRNTEEAAKWLRSLMQEAKFFECTSVWPLVTQLAKDMLDEFEESDRVDQRLAFLPAVATWVETEHYTLRDVVKERTKPNEFVSLKRKDMEALKGSYKYRTAFVFIGNKDTTNIAQTHVISYETPQLHPFRIWRIHSGDNLPLVNSKLLPQRKRMFLRPDTGEAHEYEKPVASIEDFCRYAMLALINSPRVIGQKFYYPHMRDEREKLKKHKLVGKFPLRAWTEILLKVALRPEDRSGDPSQEAHLTGERCMHYCRTYLRVRMGRLEYVEGHWRGNPALGMKRSRYRVEQ